MWIRFFETTTLANATALLRDHLSNFFTRESLLDRVRDCLPSDRARLIYDLLVVELALEWQLQVNVAYIDRARDVSPLIVKGDEIHG